MNNEGIDTRIKQLIEEKSIDLYGKRGINIVNSETKLRETEELGFDSLDMYELAYQIENEFKIDIPDKEILKMNTVKDFIDYVNSKVSKLTI